MSKIHLIGNAHLDPVWLWRWQEGFAEIKATFKSACDRLDEYPGFVFTSACASYYKWVEENAPMLFDRIKNHVESGRWELTGGWWIQPDCNVPSGESFARHALYSQRYFLEKFGLKTRVGYNVDSFGHNGMLPQILRKSGMDYYVFMRPGEHEKELPASAFRWKSPDGSEVLTYRIPFSYNNDLDEKKVYDRLMVTKELGISERTPMMFFYGVGNHGGGPTRAIIEFMENIRTNHGQDICMSPTLAYFESVENIRNRLPIVSDDLQHHASGCYSTMRKIKYLNRKAEIRIADAEKFSFISNRLFNLPYNRSEMEKAWQDVLFNQFHDIMGGCSIREAYDDAFEAYGEALQVSGRLLNAALQKISWNIDIPDNQDTDKTGNIDSELNGLTLKGFPLVVFNPNAWSVQLPVQTKNVTCIDDDEGNPVELQTVRAARTDRHFKWEKMFIADLPPLGYRVYRTYMKRKAHSFSDDGSLRIGKDFLENKWLLLKFDSNTGYLKSLFNKKSKREFLSGPGAVPIVIDDSNSDTWAHGIFSFRKESGRFGKPVLKIMEEGPLRVVLRVSSIFNKSTFRQDFTLYRDLPGIHVSVTMNWQEPQSMLKLSFPVSLSNPTAVYEIPFGCIEKKPDGNEEAGHSWFAAASKTHGLAVVNDSSYSYDILDSEMRMTLVRSAFYADHFGETDDYNEPMDIGIHRMQYLILPFEGSYKKAGLYRHANELNNPPISIYETFHSGSLPLKNNFLACENKNIHIHALKMCEDDRSAVIRASETASVHTNASFSFPLMGKYWTAEFKPYEIKTFKISEDEIIETNMLEL